MAASQQDKYSSITLHFKLLQGLAAEILQKFTHQPAAFKDVDMPRKDDIVDVVSVSIEKPQRFRRAIQKVWRKKTKSDKDSKSAPK